ncbi:MAG: TIGR03560 family F420-dependent LLM class oxidoreductase [Candidatus Thorarchaeota archaeon]|nr:TIGR03560 family F420-dependent LLM class oxidoreductase [Candidatus Thorarchaeota archaeon]
MVTLVKICINIEPQLGYTYEDIVILAKAAEDAGFYRFSVSDHFFSYVKGTEMLSHEAWTTIALLTPQTERIVLGTQMTCQSYRNPALLAKIVASLDNASNGRMDLGIGAGWKESEYEAYGYPFPSAKTRVLQLREALQIINLLWTEERPSFEGEFYRIKETMFQPKPIQKPRVPIWIGTMKGNAPMMEETAARYADGVDFHGEDPTEYAQKMENVKAACDRVGRDFQELQWSLSPTAIVLGEDEEDYRKRKQEVVKEEWTQKILDDPMKEKWLEAAVSKELAGPPDVVIEKLSEYKGKVDIVTMGLPYIGNLRENGLETIRILKEHIAPKL